MIFNLLSRIFGLVRKQQVLLRHSCRVIPILVLLLVPARFINVPLVPTGAPPGWTAHNPIIVLTPPKINGMSPFVISGFYAAQIRKAYGIDLLESSGAGKTIAIIDAYGDPNITTDLTNFDTQFALPAANLTIAYPGGTPGTNSGWAMETALDVEWAHAVAPAANIILVVAMSNSITDLLTAVDYATTQGANVVSMSWGGPEFSSEATYDSYFNHPDVIYLASAGDSGAGVSWPAVSPYVVGVGGTTLVLNADDTYGGESAWSGSGGGTSAYVVRPSYQNGFQSALYRGVPDVAFDADPASGVAVNYNNGWIKVGGD